MRRALLLAALLPGLAACADFSGAGLPSAPEVAPAPAERKTERSAESVADERFYARVEAGLITRGLLRVDGGGPDTPYTSDMLARNFMALAFSQEFSEVGGRLVRRTADSTLHRWAAPVRIMPIFGQSVAAESAAQDRAEVERLARRLSRSTRHPVAVVGSGGNFPVLILNRQELSTAGERMRQFLPGVGRSQIAFVENMPRETYCVVLAADRADDGTYTNALAVIRAELPERLRASCLHEEIAQGFGLADDSPDARPSVFNDDDEFGRLTSMDELLLRLLYDPRLGPGMTADDARPVVRRIARELLDGGTV